MFLLSHLLSITLSARGVSYLFDIQVKTFDPVYDGEDVIAQARTGTGKTFSFAIPLVEKLQRESVQPARGRAPKVQAQVHSRNPFFALASQFDVIFLVLSVGAGLNSNQRTGCPGRQRLQRHHQEVVYSLFLWRHLIYASAWVEIQMFPRFKDSKLFMKNKIFQSIQLNNYLFFTLINTMLKF